MPLVNTEIPWVDIVLHENCAFYETWALEDENGDALNITGDTFEAHIRADFDDTLALLLDISPTVASGTGGTILWNKTEADIETLTVGSKMVYDLKRNIGGDTDQSQKLVRGRVIKEPSATT